MERFDFAILASRIASFMLRLVTVPKCIACGKTLEKEGEICPDCLAIWTNARETRCPR